MNQHYVPRCYLKHFAVKKGKEYYVDVHNKLTKNVFNTNITNICAEKDFYTLDENTAMSSGPLGLEKLFSNGLEPMFERAHKILINDNIFEISDIQRVEILIGIFQLFVRNPRILNISVEHHTTEITKLCAVAKREGTKGITYLEEDFSFKEWGEEGIIEYFTDLTTKTFKEAYPFGITQIGAFHEFAKFEVSKIMDESQFFTSDNPLTMEDLITKDDQPFLKSKEFNIPLTPKYSLRLFHDNTVPLNTIKRIYTKSGNVAINNSFIHDQSNRFIIGAKKSFEEYFKMWDFLSKPNLDLKMDMIRQIMLKIPTSNDTDESREIMKEYLKIYDGKGTLTNLEEYELQGKMREETIKWKKNRLS